MATSKSQSRRVHRDAPAPAGIAQEDRVEGSAWREWIEELGRRQRRMREFLGLSQERVARLAGVSQGAVSRLETATGLATPILIIAKIYAVLADELRKLDPTLLSTELRESLEQQRALVPSRVGPSVQDLPLTEDPTLEEIIRIYRETPERQRGGVLSVVRAIGEALGKTVPLGTPPPQSPRYRS